MSEGKICSDCPEAASNRVASRLKDEVQLNGEDPAAARRIEVRELLLNMAITEITCPEPKLDQAGQIVCPIRSIGFGAANSVFGNQDPGKFNLRQKPDFPEPSSGGHGQYL